MTNFTGYPAQGMICRGHSPGATPSKAWSSLLAPSEESKSLTTRDQILEARGDERADLVEEFVSEDFDETRFDELLVEGEWGLQLELLAACCDFEVEITQTSTVRHLTSLLESDNDLIFLSAAQTLLICCKSTPWTQPDLGRKRNQAMERLRDELG